MQTNLLIIDNQNAIPSKKLGHSKGLIEEGQEQGREEKDFSSTLAEVANEQQSHPGSSGESRVERKKGENGEAESEDLKKDANGETESEDIKEGANEGLAKAGKTSGPFLVLDGKTGEGSGNERVVEGKKLPGSDRGSLTKLKVINKGAPSLNQTDQKRSIEPDKANALKTVPTELGLERKQGEAKTEKEGTATPRVVEKSEKTDGLLRAMSVTPETKGKETSEAAATPRGLEKSEKTDGLLRAMSVTPETKGKETSEVAAKPQGLSKVEKTDGLLRTMSATPETKGKETSEAVAIPRVVEKTEKTDGLLRAMSATPETKGKETSEAAATPRVVEKSEKTDGLLRAMSVTPETKGKETPEAAATPRGLEKSGNALTDLGEESGRINRGVQDKEPAAQKFGMGSMKGSAEESVQKEPGTEGSSPRLGIDLKDAGSETVKVKVSEGSLIHKKVEKTEPGSGENSNLSSRNFSTPDKGAGVISQSKEPQTFTKSAQADTLRQIVNKAAFNLQSGRSEFKIDLKPESLGHLKMQILTENHHVTVRILAENPLVKDLIESNLAQLKANFQNQGLEIEKFDVSVARDSDQNGTGDGRYESGKMKPKSGDTENGYGGKAEEPEAVDNLMRKGQQKSAVDFFA